jgi:hypothetical protein
MREAAPGGADKQMHGGVPTCAGWRVLSHARVHSMFQVMSRYEIKHNRTAMCVLAFIITCFYLPLRHFFSIVVLGNNPVYRRLSPV